MPPIEYRGETVGYYADKGSDEWKDYANDPTLRQMFPRTDAGVELDFRLFIPRDGSTLQQAAHIVLLEKGIFNTEVNFIKNDATPAESASYSARIGG